MAKNAKKKVTFGKIGAEEERTVMIEADGFEPFEITYRVPNKLAAAIDIISETDEEGKGIAVIKYISRHILKWTLPPEPTEENISALDNVSILLALFRAIANRNDKAKN